MSEDKKTPPGPPPPWMQWLLGGYLPKGTNSMEKSPAEPTETPKADWSGVPQNLALLIGAMGAMQGGMVAYMDLMERVRKQREELELLRIVEIDDRLYEHFLATSVNGLLAADFSGDAAAAVEHAASFATAMLSHVRERRSPELAKEVARAALSRLSYEDAEELAAEKCSGIRHLLDAVAEEAKNDPKLDSPYGTFKRVLRERELLVAALDTEKKRHTL
jgi:hypothetical protein